MGTHRYHLTVDCIVEIDPDRLDEWIDANYDRENESIQLTDLTLGNGVTAPVKRNVGPSTEKLVWEEMEP